MKIKLFIGICLICVQVQTKTRVMKMETNSLPQGGKKIGQGNQVP
jgi:hypothetical protein